MARLSQKQLEELAQSRKRSKEELDFPKEEADVSTDDSLINKEDRLEINPKMINDVLNNEGESPYKYKLPQGYRISSTGKDIPSINIRDFPKLNVKGKFSVDRQNKGANLYLLKEIDYLLDNINEGKNKNATLNFLIWVGLQTLKGMNGTIDVRVHDSTYADGQIITSYIED